MGAGYIYGVIMILKIVIIILILLWAGAVLGISFLESWVKFRTPTLSKSVALDVGRTVFNAFHKTQLILLGLILIIGSFYSLTIFNWILLFFITMILLTQSFLLFPILNKRVDLIILGEQPSKSFVHPVYGMIETSKLILLIVLAVRLLH